VNGGEVRVRVLCGGECIVIPTARQLSEQALRQVVRKELLRKPRRFCDCSCSCSRGCGCDCGRDCVGYFFPARRHYLLQAKPNFVATLRKLHVAEIKQQREANRSSQGQRGHNGGRHSQAAEFSACAGGAGKGLKEEEEEEGQSTSANGSHDSHDCRMHRLASVLRPVYPVICRVYDYYANESGGEGAVIKNNA
jgi:hypothetical protein